MYIGEEESCGVCYASLDHCSCRVEFCESCNELLVDCKCDSYCEVMDGYVCNTDGKYCIACQLWREDVRLNCLDDAEYNEEVARLIKVFNMI